MKMKSVVFGTFAVAAFALMVPRCDLDEDAIERLERAGYTEVTLTGIATSTCPESFDDYVNGFRAYDEDQGSSVRGSVCCRSACAVTCMTQNVDKTKPSE